MASCATIAGLRPASRRAPPASPSATSTSSSSATAARWPSAASAGDRRARPAHRAAPRRHLPPSTGAGGLARLRRARAPRARPGGAAGRGTRSGGSCSLSAGGRAAPPPPRPGRGRPARAGSRRMVPGSSTRAPAASRSISASRRFWPCTAVDVLEMPSIEPYSAAAPTRSSRRSPARPGCRRGVAVQPDEVGHQRPARCRSAPDHALRACRRAVLGDPAGVTMTQTLSETSWKASRSGEITHVGTPPRRRAATGCRSRRPPPSPRPECCRSRTPPPAAGSAAAARAAGRASAGGWPCRSGSLEPDASGRSSHATSTPPRPVVGQQLHQHAGEAEQAFVGNPSAVAIVLGQRVEARGTRGRSRRSGTAARPSRARRSGRVGRLGVAYAEARSGAGTAPARDSAATGDGHWPSRHPTTASRSASSMHRHATRLVRPASRPRSARPAATSARSTWSREPRARCPRRDRERARPAARRSAIVAAVRGARRREVEQRLRPHLPAAPGRQDRGHAEGTARDPRRPLDGLHAGRRAACAWRSTRTPSAP